MAASKGKTVQQPPPGAAIILTHSFRASDRLSCRNADLQQPDTKCILAMQKHKANPGGGSNADTLTVGKVLSRWLNL